MCGTYCAYSTHTCVGPTVHTVHIHVWDLLCIQYTYMCGTYCAYSTHTCVGPTVHTVHIHVWDLLCIQYTYIYGMYSTCIRYVHLKCT